MRKMYKLFNVCLYFLKFGNLSIAWFLAKHAFPFERVSEIGVKEGKLLVRKTGQLFSIAQLTPCKRSLNLFLTVATHNEIKLDNSKEGEVTIVFGNTRIKAVTFDNYYIAQEVFGDGVYSISMNANKMVVCDVGMNVGVASLYFAGLPNVTKVYSYEPFPETYNRALSNFEMNPLLKDKIVPHNAGVGGADAVLDIPVFKGESAIMSTSDFLYTKTNMEQSHKIKVAITDIKKIIPDVFQKHSGESLVLKLDCEGAEYDIVEQLHKTGMLPKISVIVIEWHMKGYETLRNTLVANNFCTTVFPRPNSVMEDIGLIYAVNTKIVAN